MTLVVHRRRVTCPHPFVARGPGRSARLQRMTLTGLPLVPIQRTPVQQLRLERAGRQAPTATLAQVATPGPVRRRLPWGSVSSALLIVAIILMSWACTGIRL